MTLKAFYIAIQNIVFKYPLPASISYLANQLWVSVCLYFIDNISDNYLLWISCNFHIH